MRLLIGLIGLLTALASVGVLVRQQLQNVGQAGAVALPAIASAPPAGTNPAQAQARQQTKEELARVLQQGADRNRAADQ